MQNDPTRDRELASARDDLQTIGRLGDVRHTWESISRHPGEDPLCSGREPSVSATVARLLLASDNSEAPCPPDAPWPASSCRGRYRQESRRPVIELAIACVANQQSDELTRAAARVSDVRLVRFGPRIIRAIRPRPRGAV